VLIAGEPAGEGLERIGREQLDLVLWHARRVDIGHEHVHEVRKATKRVRALLRLFRDQLGEPEFTRQNASLRNAARSLTTLRTATVEIEILKGLETWRPELAPAAAALHQRLDAEEDSIRAALFSGPGPRQRLVATLERARSDVERWTLPPDLVPTEHGLRRTYRRGRQAMVRSYAAGSEDQFHRWRKRVKYLRHQLEILAPVLGHAAPAFVQRVADLGEGLGLEHDLADLETMVEAASDTFSDSQQRDALLQAIAVRRGELQAEMRPVGEWIYESKPQDFVERATTAWFEWAGRQAEPPRDRVSGGDD
jgi:CHAD domain-containing protein